MAVTIRWVGYPAAWTAGRRLKIKAIILHTTEGGEAGNSAENGAAYDKTRDDGTSTHYFTDSAGPALQEVPDGDRAHTARQHANEIGIQIEICGRAGQGAAGWADDASQATLRTTAGLVAVLLARHNLPLRRMSVAELRAAYFNNAGGPTGICDHYTATLAFPEDSGTHTDVGPTFPWDAFFAMVRAEMGGAAAGGSESHMATVFLFDGKYQVSRGDAKEREIVKAPVGVASGEMNVLCDAHRVHGLKDSRGYPAEDLKLAPRGWTEALVTLTFGPLKATVDDELTPAEIDAIASKVVEKIGQGFTQTVSLSLTGGGSATTTAAPAGH